MGLFLQVSTSIAITMPGGLYAVATPLVGRTLRSVRATCVPDSRRAALRATLRARLIASAFSRTLFSEGFS